MKNLIKKNHKGFTLVELLVVMAIIGILVSIALPKFKSVTDSANLTSFKAAARTVTESAQLYYADNNAFPTALTALDNYLNGTSTSVGTIAGAAVSWGLDATNQVVTGSVTIGGVKWNYKSDGNPAGAVTATGSQFYKGT